MFILDEEKLREYWEGIAQGFEQSPLQIIVTVICIILLITLLIITIKIYQWKKRKKNQKKARIRFEQLLDKKNITEEDRAIINLLISHFPKSLEFIPELLTNQGLFLKSARPLLDNGTLTFTALALLRKKLGFIKEKGVMIYHSTAEFPKGMSLVLFYQGAEYRAKIVEVNGEKFTIQTNAPLSPGKEVVVHFTRQTGSYSFSSIIQGYDKGKEGNVVNILHSETIERIQNRNFYRIPVRLHAEIRPLETTGTFYSTIISEISGGGAIVNNPGKMFRSGNEFLLVFSPPGKKPVQVRAKVARVLQEQTKMSIAFIAIKESVRDRIIRFIMNIK